MMAFEASRLLLKPLKCILTIPPKRIVWSFMQIFKSLTNCQSKMPKWICIWPMNDSLREHGSTLIKSFTSTFICSIDSRYIPHINNSVSFRIVCSDNCSELSGDTIRTSQKWKCRKKLLQRYEGSFFAVAAYIKKVAVFASMRLCSSVLSAVQASFHLFVWV